MYRSSAGTVHNLASVSVDLRRVVLSLQDFSDGNDVIGVGVDDNGVHGGALRRYLSPVACSDHVDAASRSQGAYLSLSNSFLLSTDSILNRVPLAIRHACASWFSLCCFACEEYSLLWRLMI